MEFEAMWLGGEGLLMSITARLAVWHNCALTYRPACASRLKSNLWLCAESSCGLTPGFGNHKKACYNFSLLANMSATPHATKLNCEGDG